MTSPTSPVRSVSAVRPLRALAVLALIGALTACGSDEESSVGVASIAGTGATATAEPTATGSAEEQLLDYVECLRGQGLDVPDPTVDADGDLVLGGGGAGGPGQGGAPQVDQDELAAAQEVCGEIPEGALGIDEQDLSEIEDAALAFARCMRAEGIEVADPDFSGGLPGAGGGQGGQGPFGDLDTDDPKVAAAMEKCQGELSGVLPGGGS